jgi:hypothetical protein
MERRLGPVFAVFVALAGAALLIVAALIYVLYGFCEDDCNQLPRTEWRAIKAMLPFGCAAIVVMTFASYLFMIGAPGGRPSWGWAAAVAVVSCVLFVLGLRGLVALVEGVRDDTTAWILGVPAVIIWVTLTGVAARSLARRRTAAS